MSNKETQEALNFMQKAFHRYKEAREANDQRAAEAFANGIAMQAKKIYNNFLNIQQTWNNKTNKC